MHNNYNNNNIFLINYNHITNISCEEKVSCVICILEDEIKTGGDGVGTGGGGTIKSPINNRNRNGSTTEMAVDQLQASEKLIAGKCFYYVNFLQYFMSFPTHLVGSKTMTEATL